MPVHYFWACYKLEFIETELIAEHGQYEGRHRFEKKLLEAGISQRQWRHYQLARHFCRFSDMDRRQLAKLDRPDCSQSGTQEQDAARDTVERALNSLHSRHAQILKLRYGIGQPECTLQEIAEMLDLTRERIRQIQIVAEKKLIWFLRKNDHSGEFPKRIEEIEEIEETLLEDGS